MSHSFTETALNQADNVYMPSLSSLRAFSNFLFLPTFEENRIKRDESVQRLVGSTVLNRTQLTFTCWNSETFLQMLTDNFFPCC